MTFRITAAAILLFTVVACSRSTTPTASTAPPATSVATPTPSASAELQPHTSVPAGTHACQTSDLTATVAQNGHAAGTAYDDLTFTNKSSTPCTLTGYPGVSLVGAGGNEVGHPATRNSVHPSVAVTLAAGGAAYSLIGFPNPANFPSGQCSSTKSTDLQVYPPGQNQAILIPLVETYCPGFSVAAVSATKG